MFNSRFPLWVPRAIGVYRVRRVGERRLRHDSYRYRREAAKQ